MNRKDLINELMKWHDNSTDANYKIGLVVAITVIRNWKE